MGSGRPLGLSRSSPSCLNRPAQRTDFVHGLVGMRFALVVKLGELQVVPLHFDLQTEIQLALGHVDAWDPSNRLLLNIAHHLHSGDLTLQIRTGHGGAFAGHGPRRLAAAVLSTDLDFVRHATGQIREGCGCSNHSRGQHSPIRTTLGSEPQFIVDDGATIVVRRLPHHIQRHRRAGRSCDCRHRRCIGHARICSGPRNRNYAKHIRLGRIIVSHQRRHPHDICCVVDQAHHDGGLSHARGDDGVVHQAILGFPSVLNEVTHRTRFGRPGHHQFLVAWRISRPEVGVFGCPTWTSRYRINTGSRYRVLYPHDVYGAVDQATDGRLEAGVKGLDGTHIGTNQRRASSPWKKSANSGRSGRSEWL